MKFIKKVIYVIAFLFFAIFLFGDEEEVEPKDLIGTSTDPNQTWAIYWYLCGSDLESDGGAASADLEEMMNVDLPENIKVIIQTGGAYSWENENINSNKIQRFEYSSKGLKLVDERPQANMGSAKTLADFLRFSTKNYPADKKMVIFWNHGGGSVSGAAFDEIHNDDSLKLSEFYKAFDSVFDLSVENPPFDVIGFDTCLMATIDTAYTFADIGRYLVASEENEPGGGWSYDGFLSKLAKDPGMDGARLGQHIADTYMDSAGWFFEDDATLSVVDLQKALPLFDAYEELGAEALRYALEDPSFFFEFGRGAEKSENYGGNSRDQGYTNMVDLGDLVKNCAHILPENQEKVIRLLNESVIYQVKGMYHEDASGLSCYYSYNGDEEDFYNYLDQGCSDSFKYLYGYGFVGDIPPEGMEYIYSLGYRDKKLPYVPTITTDGDKEYPVKINKDGYVTMKLEDKIVKLLKTVYLNYAYIDEKENKMIFLGQDNDMQGDFDKGKFTDNFRGVWGSIDGHLVYMEIAFEGDDFTAYSIPILLNDEEYKLRVIYNYDKEKYEILGARKAITKNGMADKNFRQLKKGDKITTILYETSLDTEDDDISVIENETFKVTNKTKFKEIKLSDGLYTMMFELVDSKNNSAYSEMVGINIKDGDISVEK